jgi:predicted nuclease of predicted toxin-antitoxin system
MRILIDVNLSPDWVQVFANEGITAVHWTSVGDPRAPDLEVMAWARANEHIVFTHDLDFGVLLAMTRSVGPSVVQLRMQDVMPKSAAAAVLEVFRDHEAALDAGAIISIDQRASRVRILPIKR